MTSFDLIKDKELLLSKAAEIKEWEAEIEQARRRMEPLHLRVSLGQLCTMTEAQDDTLQFLLDNVTALHTVPDGHRMVYTYVCHGITCSLILPAKPIKEWVNIQSQDEGTLRIQIPGSRVPREAHFIMKMGVESSTAYLGMLLQIYVKRHGSFFQMVPLNDLSADARLLKEADAHVK